MTSEAAYNRIEEARILLEQLGFDRERSNERSAPVLLAMLSLRPDQPWSEADSQVFGTRAIMDFIRDQYRKNYAPNSRETVRRFTLHQFAEALLVEQNPDKPDRPVNSPNWNYRIHPRALAVIRSYGSDEFDAELDAYLADVPGLIAQYAAARILNRIPIMLPSGEALALSPGGQNVLIKQIVDDFCGYYTPSGEVLYVGDADAKWAVFEQERLNALGVAFDQHGKMPDLVVHLGDRNPPGSPEPGPLLRSLPP